MKNKTIVLVALFLGMSSLIMAMTAQEVAERMALAADQMEPHQEAFGYWQESVEQKLNAEDEVKEETKKLSRIIWLEGHPYLELVRLNDQDLDSNQKSKEAKRKAEFLKRLKKPKKDDKDEEISWKELFQKYDFTFLPSDDSTKYVVSYQPKQKGLTERHIAEKVFNRLSGTLWIDEEFHLVRATANLSQRVKIGLGVVGRLDELQIDYRQQKHQDLMLPASLEFRTRAQMMMVKTVRQHIEARYFDYFERPGPSDAEAR